MGMMCGLSVWGRHMQGATATPLTAKYPHSGTESPQSIAEILRFLCLSAKAKTAVNC